MIDRVVQGRKGRIWGTFLDPDGAAIDPDAGTVKVTVKRHDGTLLVDDADAEDDVSFVLEQTDALDLLTVTWTAMVDGDEQTVQTDAEIVGGVFFEIAGLTGPLAGLEPKDVGRARTQAEQDLERACRAAFVPRFIFEVIRRRPFLPPWWWHLRLSTHGVSSVRGISMDGVPLSESDLSNVFIENSRDLWRSAGFRGRIEVAYEAGYDRPPAGAARAARLLAERYLVGTGIDPRATQLRTDAGTLNLANGGEFGIPEVDAFVERERRIDMSLA